MSTFLLRWNPAISSFTESNFRHFVKHFPFCETNWSVYDYTRASSGDTFYMMRVGESKPGIVMAGRFCSEPTKMADWSSEGKVRFYCDLWLNFIANPELFNRLHERLDLAIEPEAAEKIENFDFVQGNVLLVNRDGYTLGGLHPRLCQSFL